VLLRQQTCFHDDGTQEDVTTPNAGQSESIKQPQQIPAKNADFFSYCRGDETSAAERSQGTDVHLHAEIIMGRFRDMKHKSDPYGALGEHCSNRSELQPFA